MGLHVFPIPIPQFFLYTNKQLPIFILLPRTMKKIILWHVLQFMWMISHRFDSFIAFLTVGLSPVLGSWEGAHDNTSNGFLKPLEDSAVYVANEEQIH